MLSAKSEAEIGERAARFLKAELKRADVTYDELAKRLKEYGRDETRDSIASKLKRGRNFFPSVLRCFEPCELPVERYLKRYLGLT
jgi:hypothetical protein